MTIRWPWKRAASQDQLIVSWSEKTLAYVRARGMADGTFAVQQLGVERLGADSVDDFARRLQTLGLKGGAACVMLRPEQYQLLQIEAPPVAPEELRSAARYQIREMANVHIDDITMDVLRVGDGKQKGVEHLFVVAATTAVVRETLDLGAAMNWTVSVIDIQETAQRNLQSALARQEARQERADALLVIAGGNQAVLTISANDELFLTRRLDLPPGFMEMEWSNNNVQVALAPNSYTPVEEYVPIHNVADESHVSDYSGAHELSSGQKEDDQAQRVLVEVQRSVDLWGRTWSSLPLSGLRVYAGERTAELAQWLSQEMGQSVLSMGLDSQFTGLQDADAADLAYCLPLLGVLLRTETRKL